MSIMSYESWKKNTTVPLKPRSKALKYLDACIKEYDKNRGSRPHFDALIYGLRVWTDTKTDGELSIRNKNGAITQLWSEIINFRDKNMPFAHRGEQFRPNALMREIKEGAKALSEGTLKTRVKANITIGVTDTVKGKVIWEEFDDDQLVKARKAWSDAYDCARMANDAMARISRDSDEQMRFQLWFGASNPGPLNTVRMGIAKMWQAFQSSQVTIVLREDIQTHLVNGNDPFDTMEESFAGSDVYGFVWNHSAGSGYRVIMGKYFLADPDPLESAQTIYHELTHKVLATNDHAYGRIKSRGLGATQQPLALTNADNWGYYAISFMKGI